jgi:hypothetical protein
VTKEEILDALVALTSDCMASDFNEHWDSFKRAEEIIVRERHMSPWEAELQRKAKTAGNK